MSRLTMLALLLTARLASGQESAQKLSDQKTDLIHRKSIEKAEASVAEAKKRVEKDPTRPIYHLQPPAFWNNDPNGPIVFGGEYHLFYQHNPYGDNWGHMHWGHFKSKDLAHWQHMPIALAPSEDLGEEHCFSGCAAVTKNKKLMLIYTSIGKRLPEQWAAVPDDDQLMRWGKHPANPILTEKLHGNIKVHEWRDPFVFVHEGRNYLVAGGNLNANKGGQAVVNVYCAENEELTQWKYLGVLFQHPDASVKNIECPNFFKLGEKWVLIVSQGQPVQYFVGTLDGSQMRFRAEKRGVMDYGNYYAPNCMEDNKGRRILWGWVKDFPAGKGWNGCMTLPRILTLGFDGQLVQEPAPELQKLRQARMPGPHITNMHVSDSSRVLDNIQGDALEIVARIDPGDAKGCGLKVRRSADGRRAVTITYDGKQLDVAGMTMPLTLPAEKRILELHVFVDHSVVEVYTNQGQCLTRVIDAGPDDKGVEVFAKGGDGTIQSLEAWPMTSIWADQGANQSEK
jgi:beta-fructofuranosidase